MNEYRKDQNIWYSQNLARMNEIERMINSSLENDR